MMTVTEMTNHIYITLLINVGTSIQMAMLILMVFGILPGIVVHAMLIYHCKEYIVMTLSINNQQL